MKQVANQRALATPVDASKVNELHRNGILSAAQGVCFLALAGLELQEAKKRVGHGGFESWIEENCDFNVRTAQRYMSLAEGVKGRALKNDKAVVFQLLSRAPGDLSEKQRAQLIAGVQKITDGQTVADLYLEFGITKKPAGAGLRGKKRKRTPGAADVNDAAEIASDLWKPTLDFIEEDGIEKRSWKDLPSKELTRLREAVNDLARLLKQK